MGIHSSLFRMDFRVTGGRSFDKMRNRIKGVGEQSYQTFNAISRSLSKLEKQTGRTINKFGRMAMGGGLMYGAFRTLNYSLLQSNSLIQTNTILLEEMFKSKSKAQGFISTIENIAGAFGQDLTELMSSSRGLVQTMGQAFGTKLKPQHLEKMLKLLMTVHSLDTENRPLSFTAFSFKEMFQGQGALDFRSLRSRLEINLGRSVEEGITEAIKSKDIEKSMDLINKAFVNIGIDSERIMQRFLKQGVSQNISRFSSFVLRLFQNLGKSSFNELIKPLAFINAEFVKLFTPDSQQYKSLQMYSEQLRVAVIKPLVDEFSKMFSAFSSQKDYFIKNFINMIKTSGQTLQSFGGIFGALFSGIAGQDMNTKDYTKMFEDINSGMIKFNEILKSTKSIFETLQTPIHMIGKAINLMVSAISSLPAPLLALLGLGAIGKGIGFGGKVIGSTASRFTGMGGTRGASGYSRASSSSKTTRATKESDNISSGAVNTSGGTSATDVLNMAGNLAMIGSVLPLGKIKLNRFKSSKNKRKHQQYNVDTTRGQNTRHLERDLRLKEMEQYIDYKRVEKAMYSRGTKPLPKGDIPYSYNKKTFQNYRDTEHYKKSLANARSIDRRYRQGKKEEKDKKNAQIREENLLKHRRDLNEKQKKAHGIGGSMSDILSMSVSYLPFFLANKMGGVGGKMKTLTSNLGMFSNRIKSVTTKFLPRLGLGFGTLAPALLLYGASVVTSREHIDKMNSTIIDNLPKLKSWLEWFGMDGGHLHSWSEVFKNREIEKQNNEYMKQQSLINANMRKVPLMMRANFGFGNINELDKSMQNLLQDPKKYLQYASLFSLENKGKQNPYLQYMSNIDKKDIPRMAEYMGMTEDDFRSEFNLPTVSREETVNKLQYGSTNEKALYEVMVNFDASKMTDEATKKIVAVIYDSLGKALAKKLEEQEQKPNKSIETDTIIGG